MARLKEKYNQEIKTNLQKKLGLSNAMEVPRIKKITVNMVLEKQFRIRKQSKKLLLTLRN